MNFGDWTVEIAPHDKKNPAAQVFADTLYSFFSLFPFKAVEHAKSADLIPEAPGRLIVIPSAGEETVKEYFKCLISCAYGSKKETGMSDHRYLFIDLGRPSIFFDGLMRPLTHCNIARKSKVYSLLPEIVELLSIIDPKPISSFSLRQTIECTTFSSGAEEMQEIYFRDVSIYHNLFDELKDHISEEVNLKNETDKNEQSEVGEKLKEKLPAVRLLLGALAAGDIEQDSVVNTLCRMGINAEGDELKKHFLKLVKERKAMHLDNSYLAALSKYLEGRRILVVEDRLKEQNWNIVIPILFGALEKELEDNKREQKIGAVLVSHANNVDAVLDEKDCPQEELLKYDIILLDLYSSETDALASSGHTQADIGYSITKFCERLEILRDELPQKNLVPVSFPRVVVFSADRSGLTARTMIKELGASDYFFKSADAKAHKSEYYATFRNALIHALKENVTEVLSLPQFSAKKSLDKWLGQFRSADRAMILRIMKHFRYYSAKSIVCAFDRLLDLPGMSQTSPCSSNENKGCISLLGCSSYLEPRKYIFAGLGRANKSGPATLVLLSKSQWNKNLNRIPELEGYKEIKDRHPSFTAYEDLPSAIFKEFKVNKNQNIPVILVDDFIGSGGQVRAYVKEAAEDIIRYARSNDCPEIYDAVKNAFESFCSGPRVELHVLFAIGLLSEPLLEKVELRRIKENKNSFSGLMKTTLCRKPNEHLIGNKKDNECKCVENEDLVFKVHIADAISDLKCICGREGISFQEIGEILQGYTCITCTRDNEFPCQFEPLGWKRCGGLVATYANAQGNTLPIIWGEGIEKVREWKPLFPRFFNPWTNGEPEGRKDKCPGKPSDCDLLVGVPKDSWPEKAKNYRNCRKDSQNTLSCWTKLDKKDQ